MKKYLSILIVIGMALSVCTAQAATLISSFTPGSDRNNFTGCVGGSFTVGGSPITITSLGLRMGTSDTGKHAVYLFNGSLASAAVVTSSSIDLTGGTVGTFYYSAASATLASNTLYMLGSDVTSGDGQQWADEGAVSYNGASGGGSTYHSSTACSATTSFSQNTAGNQYLGVDANGALPATNVSPVLSLSKGSVTLAKGTISIP